MPKNVFFLCFFQKIFKKICVCQKKVVPLHSLLKKQDFFCQLKFVIESVAQQVEHIAFKDGVLGSNPSWFTIREFRLSFLFVFVCSFFTLLTNLHAKLLLLCGICKKLHEKVFRKCYFFFGTKFVVHLLQI